MKKLENSLIDLFSRSLSDMLPGAGRVGVCTPAEPQDLMLGLYLYGIRPCFDINTPALIQKGSGFREQPPHFLTLYYLLTAYSKADGGHRVLEEHNIIFRAAETLLNTPVLTERELGFRPGTYIDKLQIQMLDLSPEELTNIWVFHENPYRLSVGFKINPVEVSALAGSPIARVSEVKYENQSDNSMH